MCRSEHVHGRRVRRDLPTLAAAVDVDTGAARLSQTVVQTGGDRLGRGDRRPAVNVSVETRRET